MVFLSGAFVLFLAATLTLYYLVPKKFQWMLLLAANLWFYLSGGVKAAAYLAFTTVTTWAAGLLLEKLNEAKKAIPKTDKDALASNKAKKKAVTAAVLILNFGMLYLLKYLGFTVEALSKLVNSAGILWEPAVPTFALPLGVSFYIFQSVGYVIDQYRGKYPAEHNPARFLLFTSFFPQMVQGPISRFDKLGVQLREYHPFDAENLREGIQIALWGYCKKMIIADRAAVAVGTFFGNYESYSGSVTAFAVFLYCIELYCDFSGGIDITRGAAKMLGIDLEENFRRPIFALTLAEYWRRWHITLGGWMRDYVFYPLSLSKPFGRLGKWAREHIGGKAAKILPTSAATFIVYLIIGIWHGANFRYIAYGFWNGAIITSSLLLAGVYSKLRERLHIRAESKGWHAFQMARTSFLVFLGRYITRSPRLLTGLALIGHTFDPRAFAVSDLWNGTLLHMGLTGADFRIIALATAVMLAVEWHEEKHGSVTAALAKQNGFVQWLAMTALMAALLFFGIFRGSYISSEFIYKQY